MSDHAISYCLFLSYYSNFLLFTQNSPLKHIHDILVSKDGAKQSSVLVMPDFATNYTFYYGFSCAL